MVEVYQKEGYERRGTVFEAAAENTIDIPCKSNIIESLGPLIRVRLRARREKQNVSMSLILNANLNMTNLFGNRDAVAPLAQVWAGGGIRWYFKSAAELGSQFGQWSFRIST